MQLAAQLRQLQTRVVDVLRVVPGATTLYLHGSLAESTADEIADIDLEVWTANMQMSRCVWPQLLELAGPIDVALPLGRGDNNTAFAVTLRGESPYHKIDIGLRDSFSADAGGLGKSPHVKLWSQAPAPPITSLPVTEAYIPGTETCGYLLMDALMSCVRYAKARKRGQDFTCWRFLRGMFDRMLLIMLRQEKPDRSTTEPLSTWDYRAFDRIVSPDRRADLHRHLDWSHPYAMDTSCVWFAEQTVTLLIDHAARLGEVIPQAPIERLLMFLSSELAVASMR